MRNNIWKPILSSVAIIFLCLVVFVLVKGVKSQESNSQNTSSEVEAIRRGGLKEAARIKRHYVSNTNTSYWMKYDLESLTKNSVGIIIGVPVSNASQLTADGQFITTEYQVKVRESIKGSFLPDEIVRVSLPGGKVVFEDGTSAEIKTPDLERMESGKTYTLFLSQTKNTDGGFNLTGGGQGLFELSTDKSIVKPHGHDKDIVQKYKNKNTEEFLDEIRAAVRKHPEVSVCCN